MSGAGAQGTLTELPLIKQDAVVEKDVLVGASVANMLLEIDEFT